MAATNVPPPILRKDSQKYRNKAAFKKRWPRAFRSSSDVQSPPPCDVYLVDAIQLVRQVSRVDLTRTAYDQLTTPLLFALRHAIQQHRTRTVAFCFDQHLVAAPYKATERRRRREARPTVDGDHFEDDDDDDNMALLAHLLDKERPLPDLWPLALAEHSSVMLPGVIEVIVGWLTDAVRQHFPEAASTRLYVSGHAVDERHEMIHVARITAEHGLQRVPELDHALVEADHQLFHMLHHVKRIRTYDDDDDEALVGLNTRVIIVANDTDILFYGTWFMAADDAREIDIVWQNKSAQREWVDLRVMLNDMLGVLVSLTFVRAFLVMMLSCGNDYAAGLMGISQDKALERLLDQPRDIFRGLLPPERGVGSGDDDAELDARRFSVLLRVIYDNRALPFFMANRVTFGAHYLHRAVMVRGILSRLGRATLWYPPRWSDYAYDDDEHLRVYA